MNDKNTSGIFYIKSLDGIRAIAVTIVFLAHAGYEKIIPGGFGVTIFFFLSGFLITTLLRMEYEKNGDIKFKDFYLRRIFRIFPPLYIVLLTILALCGIGIIYHEMQFNSVAAQFLHLTNYFIIFYGESGFIPGTSILWSLCVEEHFYFVFPLVLWLLIRKISYQKIALSFVAFAGIILLWRCYIVFVEGGNYVWSESFLPRTYLGTDTRIDSIIFGCIMGVWGNPVLDKDCLIGNLKKIVLLIVSFIVLLFCFLYRDPYFRETFRYTLQGIALFPLFYLAVLKSDWVIFKWLNWGPIRGIGIISYTIYLFHQTGISLVNSYSSFNAKWVNVILSFILTIGFSTLMYYLVERNMAALRRKIKHS